MADSRDDDDKLLKRVLEQLVDLAQKNKKASPSRKNSDRLAEAVTTRRDQYFNPHFASYTNFGESGLAMMLFMDIVGYSNAKFQEGLEAHTKRLNKVVLDALKKARCDLDHVICLPSGDGMCLCFQDHKKPLQVAANIDAALRRSKMKLRMGIHSGGLTRVKDLKEGFTMSGDAINVSQRAMDFGDAHHIICTEEVYKELSKLRAHSNRFKPLGRHKVKHDRELELFNYACNKRKIGNPAPPKKSANTAEKESTSPPKKSPGRGPGASP